MPITDEHAEGLTEDAVVASRYEVQHTARYESAGLILSLIPPGSRVLDVGCGTGSLTKLIQDTLSCEVVGLEPHIERFEAARAKGLQVRHAILSEDIVDELGQFKVVIFADVLEHLVDPLAVLRIAKKLLSPDGCAIVSVPNVAHWTVRLNLLRGRFDYRPSGIMDATHLRWFTLTGLRRLLIAAGFQMVKVKGSAGMWIAAYHSRLPWRFLPPRVRTRVVCSAVQHFHSLFACQHIVKACFGTPVDVETQKNSGLSTE